MWIAFLNLLLWPPVYLFGKLRTVKIFLRARLGPSAVVLDIGSGHNPWFRSNILCERFLVDDVERCGPLAVGRRPLCNADATALPFKDKSFDFVYCSHVAEHIEDLGTFLREIQRVGRAGYVETPNYLFEQAIGTTTHTWALWVEDGVLHAERKWIPAAPARVYHEAHRILTYPVVAYVCQRLPELRVMTFWWKDRFDFVLHDAPEPLTPTRASA